MLQYAKGSFTYYYVNRKEGGALHLLRNADTIVVFTKKGVRIF